MFTTNTTTTTLLLLLLRRRRPPPPPPPLLLVSFAVGDATVGYPRVLMFARGGHFVHRSHTDIVADAIIQLLTHVTHENRADFR